MKWTLNRNQRWILVALVLVIGTFLGVTATTSHLGFPLDDSWIHQTYARNLAWHGRWEYVPGEAASTGSTAPLWTFCLAVGYLLGIPYLGWTYLLGAGCLYWLALAGMRLWRTLWPEQQEKEWGAGLVIVCTWPLAWATVSGMETLLFAALGVQVITLYCEFLKGTRENEPSPALQRKLLAPRPSTLGLLAGLLILTRPEGLVLFLLILVGFAVSRSIQGQRFTLIVSVLGTAALPLIPYFAFNLFTGGAVWPNTFYAKQAEYAFLLEEPLWLRLPRLLLFSLGGPSHGEIGPTAAHFLLVPGLVLTIWRAFQADLKNRQLLQLLPLLWAGGHLFLYAWRLPVTYQHGRYLQPILPVWILYGLAGIRPFFASLPLSERLVRPLRLAAALTFATLLMAFLLLGVRAYAGNVEFIEAEMVTIARWVAQNTPPDALIATHDIGAIGYFAERPILDLAGLLSPEVIPLLSDETALAQYILASEADYLVTAPGWPYTQVANVSTLLFTTNYPPVREIGLNNMSVYRLH